MNVTVNMKKIVIGIVVLLIIGGSVLWWNSTKDERAAKAEIKIMIKYVQRQALEIAIIEQASKLVNYKQQLAAKQPATNKIIPNPPMPAPPIPAAVSKE